DTRRVFEGHLISVRVDEVDLPDGRASKREIVEHPGAVAAVPITSDGEVLLVRQWRHPAERALLEIPAGTREEGEEPIETLRRELAEEIGHDAATIDLLAEIFVAPGYSTELIGLYLATNLEPADGDADEDENIEIVRMPLRDAIRMCRDGELLDSKTVAALLLAGVRMAG
ncbi:MAG: NUDIX domain-containing protein, partial [Armatimonadia bacterium]|nr:NUDIX domain-containing protein [Armatimonadia bacterium]